MLKAIFKKIFNLDVSSKRRPIYKELDDLATSTNQQSELGLCTEIGYGTNINGPAFIASTKKSPVTIGKFCAIAHNLRIRPRNHYTGYINLQDKFQNKYNLPSLNSIKGPVEIGNNVWIADNVIILSGVTIGDGAVIGAGSIVTKNIPAFSIAVGNPAKVIKKRFSDKVTDQLKGVKWWDWDEQKVRRNRLFFETDFSRLDSINLEDILVD